MQACTATATIQSAALQRRPARSCRRMVITLARQQPSEPVTRREAGLAALAALAALSVPQPAHALFGLGGGKAAAERYEKDTAQIITDTRSAALLERGAPNREEVMLSVRKEINDWVARYRRDQAFSGRPSYGNVYSAVNAVAGHLNSFGPTAPIPKKRLERLVKELDDAERFLARGR